MAAIDEVYALRDRLSARILEPDFRNALMAIEWVITKLEADSDDCVCKPFPYPVRKLSLADMSVWILTISGKPLSTTELCDAMVSVQVSSRRPKPESVATRLSVDKRVESICYQDKFRWWLVELAGHQGFDDEDTSHELADR